MAYNLTGNPCAIFADHSATIAKVRLGISSLALLLCVLAGLVILCCKLYHSLTQRLYGYLTLANAIYSTVFIVQYFAKDYEQSLVFPIPCVIAGFLMQYTGWVVLLLTTAITVHLFLLIVYNKKVDGKRIEIFYILLGVGLPLLLCWIPFINSTYGLSGDWCWIRWDDFNALNATSSSECPLYLQGLIEKMVLWSGPVVLLVLGSSAAIAYMMVVLILRARRRNTYDDLEEQYRALLKEALPLLTFPVAFYIICILEISYHIHYAIHFHAPDFGFWLVGAICEPVRAVPNILVLFCPGVIVVSCKRRKEVQRVLDTGGREQLEHQHLSVSLSKTYSDSNENSV